MKNGTLPSMLGATRERSLQNEDELVTLESRINRVETYAKIQIGALAILAAQALGIPTQDLISILVSLL